VARPLDGAVPELPRSGFVHIENSPRNQTNTHAPLPTHIRQPNTAIADQSFIRKSPMDGNPFAVFSARTFIYEALTVKRAQTNTVGRVTEG